MTAIAEIAYIDDIYLMEQVSSVEEVKICCSCIFNRRVNSIFKLLTLYSNHFFVMLPSKTVSFRLRRK